MPWESPTNENPMLIGLLVDVSASMMDSIQNDRGRSGNRLESVRDAIGDLAQRARRLAADYSDSEAGLEKIRVFALGFGFGNPLAALFGRKGPSVRDLIAVPGQDASPSMLVLANEWQTFQRHVTSLATQMFGQTPMVEGLREVCRRFERDAQRLRACNPRILFLISDGMPTDGNRDSVLQEVAKLREADTFIVSCYITGQDITEPRRLYDKAPDAWPDGARLMFDASSTLPDGSFSNYLNERGWAFSAGARMFTQVNQSEVLSEFLGVILSPLERDTPVTLRYRLLMDLFRDSDSLRAWLGRSGFTDVLAELPGRGSSLSEFVSASLDALTRRGELDASFFHKLEAEFPKRAAEIRKISRG